MHRVSKPLTHTLHTRAHTSTRRVRRAYPYVCVALARVRVRVGDHRHIFTHVYTIYVEFDSQVRHTYGRA